MTTFIRLLLIFFHLLLSVQLLSQPSSENQQDSSVNKLEDNGHDRSSPKETLRSFISAVASEQYETAVKYLNFSESNSQSSKKEIVKTLKLLLDQGYILPYSRISTDSLGKIDDGLPLNIDQIGTLTIDGEIIDALLEQTRNKNGQLIWQFSSETIATNGKN